MQVGDLVRHIEFECVGIIVRQGVLICDRYFVHWNDSSTDCQWYTECELEVLCK